MSRRASHQGAKAATQGARGRGGASDALGAYRGWRWNEGTGGRRPEGDRGGGGDTAQASEPSWSRTPLAAYAQEAILGHRRATRRPTEHPNRLLRGRQTATAQRGEHTRAEGRGGGRERREVENAAPGT